MRLPVCRRLPRAMVTIEGQSDDVVLEEGGERGIFNGSEGFVIADCGKDYGCSTDLFWALLILSL